MQTPKDRVLLAAEFDRHVDAEGQILSEYRALSDKLGEGPAAFLVNLILTEEELHHLLLRTTAKWLRDPPAAQTALIPEGTHRAQLLQYTNALRRHELETVDACQSLQASLSGVDGDLLATVLKAMALDSEKHHLLLLAVEKLLAP